MKLTNEELLNAEKVHGFLADIDEVSYKNIREDLFEVTCDGVTAIIDAEDTLVCIEMNVCDVPKLDKASSSSSLYEYLLKANAQSIHGKFALSGDKVVIKANLESQNMDANEFEAALAWVFGKASTNIENIVTIIG